MFPPALTARLRLLEFLFPPCCCLLSPLSADRLLRDSRGETGRKEKPPADPLGEMGGEAVLPGDVEATEEG